MKALFQNYKLKFLKIVLNFYGKGYILMENDNALESEFEKFYELCKPYTMTTKERLYALYKAVNYILDRDIKGVFVECGVWRGGSAMLIMQILSERGITNRDLFLYDTFEGMAKPTDADFEISNKSAALGEWIENSNNKDEEINNWCYASLHDVKENLNSIKYPSDKVHFIQGKVEETIPHKIPSEIALLRLDTDWYESTKHELIHLYPILCDGGVLIIDDYGHWAGAKKAVDEYFSDSQLLFNRIDYSCRLAVKV